MEVIRKMCRMLGTGWFLCFWFDTTPLHYTADSSFTMINVDKPSPQSTRSNMSKPETSPVGACRCCSSTSWQNWCETRRRWSIPRKRHKEALMSHCFVKLFERTVYMRVMYRRWAFPTSSKWHVLQSLGIACSQQSKISEVINSFWQNCVSLCSKNVVQQVQCVVLHQGIKMHQWTEHRAPWLHDCLTTYQILDSNSFENCLWKTNQLFS